MLRGQQIELIVAKEIDLIQKLAPQVSTVALLYNRSEVNSKLLLGSYALNCYVVA